MVSLLSTQLLQSSRPFCKCPISCLTSAASIIYSIPFHQTTPIWGYNLPLGEWVSVWGLTSHSTHNRSCRRRVFPGNRLHWYWQVKTRKQNTTYTRNTKDKQNQLHPGMVCLLQHPAKKQSRPCSYGAHTGSILPLEWLWHQLSFWLHSQHLGRLALMPSLMCLLSWGLNAKYRLSYRVLWFTENCHLFQTLVYVTKVRFLPERFQLLLTSTSPERYTHICVLTEMRTKK